MSPTRIKEQKPFRGFDISSLIRKDEDEEPKSPERKSSVPSPTSSPRVSYGPPVEKSSNPYSNIFNSNLYQQYLSQLISQHSSQSFPPSLPPFNPMLLQAQLAMHAAQSSPFLANYNGIATSVLAERMKQNRFSPYHSGSHNTSLNTSVSSSLSSPGAGSAFMSLPPRGSGSPPVSPPHSSASPVQSPSPRYSPVPTPPKNDIKSIENMINGLNGGEEGRFSLAHDSRKFI